MDRLYTEEQIANIISNIDNLTIKGISNMYLIISIINQLNNPAISEENND